MLYRQPVGDTSGKGMFISILQFSAKCNAPGDSGYMAV